MPDVKGPAEPDKEPDDLEYVEPSPGGRHKPSDAPPPLLFRVSERVRRFLGMSREKGR